LQYSTLKPQYPNLLQHLPWLQDRPAPAGPHSATKDAEALGEGDGLTLRVTLAPRDGVVEGLLEADGDALGEGVVLQTP
jgi:hypothetical protein